MATDLGTAYIQIAPSAKGIKGSITNLLNDEATSAGESSGATLGSSLIGKVKTVIAAAGIGAAIASSISEGGKLQQSLGGVETLFKDSADTVKNYASQAFKTAGVSANDYMENVTSFSAALISSCAGDTARAAEIANTAMIDMSDNANKMGTDMQSIQNAYQGFAKQNYTMLDNLKLGYGGTKSEMERLLSDAQKLSGVKYDISNLSDVYEAIHVIQQNLDITGTTAKEAETTLTGSFGQMKAAAQDFLGALSINGDIQGTMSNLVSTASTFLFGNLIPMVVNVATNIPQALVTGIQATLPILKEQGMNLYNTLISGLNSAGGDGGWIQQGTTIVTEFIDGIAQQLPQIITTGAEMLTQLIQGIFENLPQLVTSAGEIIISFIQGFSESLPTIQSSGGNLLMTIVNGILEALPSIIASAGQIIGALANGLITNLPQLLAQGASLMAQLVASILTHLPEFINAGLQLILSIASGLFNGIGNAVSNAGQAVSQIQSAFTNVDWASIGSNLISGIASGIAGAVKGLVSTAISACKSLTNSVKSFFGINSPSRLFRDDIGQWIPKGMAVGIDANTDSVKNSMDDLNKLAYDTIKDGTIDDMTLSLSASTRQLKAGAEESQVNNQQNGMTDKLNSMLTLMETYMPQGTALYIDKNRIGQTITDVQNQQTTFRNRLVGIR